jgi:hypothetical protein
MSTMSDLDMSTLVGKLNQVTGIANSRGWDLPPEYVKATAIAREAASIMNAGAFDAPLPTEAGRVAAYITATAKARLEQREARLVAAELNSRARRDALRAINDAAPSYAAKIIDVFAEHQHEFEQLLPTAPREVDARTTADQVEQHQALLRVVEDLTTAAQHRAMLGSAIDEVEAGASDPVWLVLDPRGSATLFAIRALLADMRGRLPATVDEWARVSALGMAMARGGDMVKRQERFGMATFASSNGPDGGLQDKTVDAALRLRVA